MTITKVASGFSWEVDENHRVKQGGWGLVATPELYAAIDKKFRRNGEWTALHSFLERGIYTTCSGRRVCLAYPSTEVSIFGQYLRVQKNQPTRLGDNVVTTYYKVQGAL